MKGHEVDANEKATSESPPATWKRLPGVYSLVLPSTEKNWNVHPSQSMPRIGMLILNLELFWWHVVGSTTI
jgi:hypothetical protein